MNYVNAAMVGSTLNPSVKALFENAGLTLFKWQKCFSGEHLERKVAEEDDRKTLRPACCNYCAIFSSVELRKMLNWAHAVW